jgi:hypothetical protein
MTRIKKRSVHHQEDLLSMNQILSHQNYARQIIIEYLPIDKVQQNPYNQNKKVFPVKSQVKITLHQP